MSISLHSATTAGFIRMLHTAEHLIDKAEAWCGEQSKDAEAVCGARLAPDMFDFAEQIKQAIAHAAKSVDGIRAGVVSPDRSEAPRTFTAMRQLVTQARAKLEALSEADVEELGAMNLEFRIGDQLVVPFKGQDFLLHFSQPNFYFHLTTAYGILRNLGVEIGKRDYLGSDWAKR